MRWIALVLLSAVIGLAARPAAALDPETTVRTADEILREQTTMPGARIPEGLLADAEGVAIIPDVLKIGFVAAVRRGRGVVLVREANGAWSLPQFITLTGGSVGWQAGIQGTDVVLVFMTKKSINGLMSGKFTIGADASAAAGPVGRNAAAATDARLRAEILSYSRSRGLFAGVSLDGSAIEMDPVAQSLYYGSTIGQPPRQVPESALKLVANLTQMTETAKAAKQGTPTTVPVPGEPMPAGLEPVPQPTAAFGQPVVSTVRTQLAADAKQLYGILDEQWRGYLALPKEVFEGPNAPSLESLQTALAKYDRVVQSPNYAALVSRQEFQQTYALLRDYVEELSRPVSSALALPPPPGTK